MNYKYYNKYYLEFDDDKVLVAIHSTKPDDIETIEVSDVKPYLSQIGKVVRL